MKKITNTYGTLCSIFYDANLSYAPKAEVDFYTRFIEKKTDRILEAMSGSGRLQIPLLERGFIVDGVDQSVAMLEQCKTRCATVQLNPQLYEQSLENLNIPHTYFTVLIALGSFQLIYNKINALKALKKIHSHMQSQGTLLIDIFIPDTAIETTITTSVAIDHTTHIALHKKYIFYTPKKLVHVHCTYSLIIDGAVTQQEKELIKLTWYRDTELKDMLKYAGFELIKIFDKPFESSGTSRIVHARRSA